MIRAVTYLKRRPGMPVVEFQTYWREQHPRVVRKLPGLRRYVQSHARRGGYEKREPAYDGVAEYWFDDANALRELRDTPEMAAVLVDETKFIDRITIGFMVTVDHVIVEGRTHPGMAKGIGFVKRKPGMPIDEFQQYWRENHAPLAAQFPGLRRYEQCHTRFSAYAQDREPRWDGISIIWFDDSKAMRAAQQSPEFERARADDPNFVLPEPIPFIITSEHVIIE